MLFEKFTDLIRSLSLVSSFFLNNTARPFYKENLYWLLRGNIRITISPELHFYIHCVSCKEVWLRLGLFIGKLESWINYLWHIKWSIVGYLYFHWAWIMKNECHVLDFMIISKRNCHLWALKVYDCITSTCKQALYSLFSCCNVVGAASQWWSKERMMVCFKLMMVRC